MKRVNITIEANDEADIEKIMRRYGLASRSAAIRFAVRAEVSRMEFMERGGSVSMTIDSGIDSLGNEKAPDESSSKAL